MLTLDDVRWAAAECKRQHSGEMSVSWMCDALEYARDGAPKFVWTAQTIINLARYIEPEQNSRGYRQLPVVLPSSPIAIPFFDEASYSLKLNRLLQAVELSAYEAYREFELLHPFIDGNGRVGAILYNRWMGTLNGPLLTPPEVFNAS